MYESISTLTGVLRRVTDVLLVIDEIESNRADTAAAVAASIKPSTPRRGERIGCDNVTICTPDGHTLVHSLSFSVERVLQPASSSSGHCTHMMVTGPSGSGKTALCRALLGLWPVAHGQICRPTKLAVISQRHLVPTAQLSLLDFCTYPEQIIYKADIQVAQEFLQPILERLQVQYLIEREGWNAMKSWETVLSAGEQQSLAVARTLFHAPRWVILDDCINAMPEATAIEVYSLLAEQHIGYVSVSESGAFAEFHSQILRTTKARNSGCPVLWSLKQRKASSSTSPPVLELNSD